MTPVGPRATRGAPAATTPLGPGAPSHGACRRRGADGGFTLIEIMVVVVILAILGTLVAPQIIGRIDEARVTKARNDLRLYESALDLYRMDNFRYPTTDQGLQALVTKPADPAIKNWRAEGYVKQLVQDPWNQDYVYQSPGTNGAPYDLYTLGADGQPGGEGSDADLSVREMTTR